MSRLPVISPSLMEKILFMLGFEKVRQKGSHAFYRHSDGRYTTISHHPGYDLSRPIIREILREVDVSVEQYNELLKKI